MKRKVVGLLGGSFHPAHLGHLHVTHFSFFRFKLDEIWWLFTPGNPLKAQKPPNINQRIEKSKKLILNPRIKLKTVEAELEIKYTVDTIKKLQEMFLGVKFIWLMGSDNLIQFDQWKDWRKIMHLIPIGILARPSERLTPLRAKAARVYKAHRIPIRNSRLLASSKAPAWCYVNLPMSTLSSSDLRPKLDK